MRRWRRLRGSRMESRRGQWCGRERRCGRRRERERRRQHGRRCRGSLRRWQRGRIGRRLRRCCSRGRAKRRAVLWVRGRWQRRERRRRHRRRWRCRRRPQGRRRRRRGQWRQGWWGRGRRRRHERWWPRREGGFGDFDGQRAVGQAEVGGDGGAHLRLREAAAEQRARLRRTALFYDEKQHVHPLKRRVGHGHAAAVQLRDLRRQAAAAEGARQHGAGSGSAATLQRAPAARDERAARRGGLARRLELRRQRRRVLAVRHLEAHLPRLRDADGAAGVVVGRQALHSLDDLLGGEGGRGLTVVHFHRHRHRECRRREWWRCDGRRGRGTRRRRRGRKWRRGWGRRREERREVDPRNMGRRLRWWRCGRR